MPASDFDQAVYRLAQYRPFNEGGRDVAVAIRDLVLAAAAVEDKGFSSLQACADAIGNLWHLDVEIDELRDVVENLVTEGLATRVDSGIALTNAAITAQAQTAEESETVEDSALRDWRVSVLREVPDLSDDEWKALCEDLRAWLGKVISRHGVESALILYPENPQAQAVFDSIEELGLKFLPERDDRVGELRDWAFQKFVRNPSPDQRSYLASLLNTAFYMTVLTLDSQASQLVQEKVSGQRLYLDTNFIYALLGLGVTASESLSAARLIELTQGVGYELAVTNWTISELKTSLKAAERKLTRLPLPRQDLAELMALRTGENQITKAYWVKYRDSGIMPKDFLEYYAHVEALLEAFEVTIATEGCVAVERDKGAIADQMSLLERFMGFRDKEEIIKEHDVKHRLLIERLRGEGHITFSNARYWFLTRDTKLPRYAMATLDDGHVDLPFCVGTSAWVQVMRAFTARTEDFDKSLVELLATPYLRYRTGPGVSAEVVNAVVARIAQYKGATASLAAEVLADTALTAEIATAGTDQERDEKIENAFVMKAKQSEERAAASEQREAVLRSEHTAADNALRHAQERQQKSGAEVREIEEKAVRMAEAHDAAQAAVADQRAKAKELQEQVRLQESQHETRESELLRKAAEERAGRTSAEFRSRIALAGLVATISVILGLLPVAVKSFRSPVAVCVFASLAALGICIALRIGFGHERGPRIVSLIFGFSSIVGLVLTVVLAATR